MSKLTLPVSISTLIDNIGDQIQLTPSQIISYIADANIQIEDLMDWHTFDHDVNEGYGRKMIYEGEHFEIMVMSWSAFDSTAIHDHGYTEWGAVQVFGNLEHISYELNDNHLSTSIKESLSNRDIVYVNNDLIHQMINRTNNTVLSLHVYGTSQKVNSVTGDAQLYDISNGEIQMVNGGVFYDLEESSYTLKEAVFTTDRLTEIGHYTNLLRHYFKTGDKGPQYQEAINYFHDRSFESKLNLELEMDSKRILYFVELNRARKLLNTLSESTGTIDSILKDINDLDRYS